MKSDNATGSRNANGNVLNVNWNSDNAKLNVNWYSSQNANDNLACPHRRTVRICH